MTLVAVRLFSAVAGFVDRHGTWPTKVVVPVENWLAYRGDPRSAPASHAGLAMTAVLDRVELIPVPLPRYIAVDDKGNYYDYDSAPPIPAAAEIIRASLEATGSVAARLTAPPIPNSYVVPHSLLAAGEYPGAKPGTPNADVVEKLTAFLDAGVRAFLDLTHRADKMAPYEPMLRKLAAARGIEVTVDHLAIPDAGVCEAAHMRNVLDVIDASIAEERPVYLHCHGGIGRTGMVVGCWLVRHGRGGDDALREVDTLFRSMSSEKVRRHAGHGSPETGAQRAMVRDWARHDSQKSATRHRAPGNRASAESGAGNPTAGRGTVSRETRETTGVPGGRSTTSVWPLIAPKLEVTPRLRDQMRGALIGLAVGDALGTTVEFKPRGSFAPVTDMVGGGPFKLAPGQWTDDTSMALCLAESLIERRELDLRDQMERYTRWRETGHLSSNGRCFDVGNTVSAALRNFAATGDPVAGPTGEQTAGNGSLMRLAPVPVFFFGRGADAISLAADSSRTTHGAAVAIDACRYLAALILGALRGATKEELLAPQYAPVPGYWGEHPLHPVIATIAKGSFKTKATAAIRGTAYAADSLEAALWAFHSTADFKEGCLHAVNLGDDADTTAAVFGQLAGGYYGESGIPREWRSKLAHKALIDRYAEWLFQLSFSNQPVMPGRTEQGKTAADELIAESRGDAAGALEKLLEGEGHAKEEMGVMAYYAGPMSAQYDLNETILNLRVAIGLQLAER